MASSGTASPSGSSREEQRAALAALRRNLQEERGRLLSASPSLSPPRSPRSPHVAPPSRAAVADVANPSSPSGSLSVPELSLVTLTGSGENSVLVEETTLASAAPSSPPTSLAGALEAAPSLPFDQNSTQSPATAHPALTRKSSTETTSTPKRTVSRKSSGSGAIFFTPPVQRAPQAATKTDLLPSLATTSASHSEVTSPSTVRTTSASQLPTAAVPDEGVVHLDSQTSPPATEKPLVDLLSNTGGTASATTELNAPEMITEEKESTEPLTVTQSVVHLTPEDSASAVTVNTTSQQVVPEVSQTPVDDVADHSTPSAQAPVIVSDFPTTTDGIAQVSQEDTTNSIVSTAPIAPIIAPSFEAESAEQATLPITSDIPPPAAVERKPSQEITTASSQLTELRSPPVESHLSHRISLAKSRAPTQHSGAKSSASGLGSSTSPKSQRRASPPIFIANDPDISPSLSPTSQLGRFGTGIEMEQVTPPHPFLSSGSTAILNLVVADGSQVDSGSPLVRPSPRSPAVLRPPTSLTATAIREEPEPDALPVITPPSTSTATSASAPTTKKEPTVANGSAPVFPVQNYLRSPTMHRAARSPGLPSPSLSTRSNGSNSTSQSLPELSGKNDQSPKTGLTVAPSQNGAVTSLDTSASQEGLLQLVDLPSQAFERAWHDGFQLNLLVLGSTSSERDLFVQRLMAPGKLLSSLNLNGEIPSLEKQEAFRIVENKHLVLDVTVVYGQPYGSASSLSTYIRDIVDFLEVQMSTRLNGLFVDLFNSQPVKACRADPCLHACLILVDSAQGLTNQLVEIMGHLQSRVNLVPVIVNAAGSTQADLLALQRRFQIDLTNLKIQSFKFMAEGNMAPRNQPLIVQLEKDQNKQGFLTLQQNLLVTHYSQLRMLTSTTHFELFRQKNCRALAQKLEATCEDHLTVKLRAIKDSQATQPNPSDLANLRQQLAEAQARNQLLEQQLAESAELSPMSKGRTITVVKAKSVEIINAPMARTDSSSPISKPQPSSKSHSSPVATFISSPDSSDLGSKSGGSISLSQSQSVDSISGTPVKSKKRGVSFAPDILEREESKTKESEINATAAAKAEAVREMMESKYKLGGAGAVGHPEEGQRYNPLAERRQAMEERQQRKRQQEILERAGVSLGLNDQSPPSVHREMKKDQDKEKEREKERDEPKSGGWRDSFRMKFGKKTDHGETSKRVEANMRDSTGSPQTSLRAAAKEPSEDSIVIHNNVAHQPVLTTPAPPSTGNNEDQADDNDGDEDDGEEEDDGEDDEEEDEEDEDHDEEYDQFDEDFYDEGDDELTRAEESRI